MAQRRIERRRCRAAVFCFMAFLLAASIFPAAADPLKLNDYAALFEKHRDRALRVSDGVEILTLPDGVEIIHRDSGYAGYDPKGAIGCSVAFFIKFDALERNCPSLMTEKQSQDFNRNKARLLSFYAEHAYPPASVARARERYEAAVLASEKRGKAETCETGSLEEARMLLSGLLDARALETFLASPRLPVTNPCM